MFQTPKSMCLLKDFPRMEWGWHNPKSYAHVQLWFWMEDDGFMNFEKLCACIRKCPQPCHASPTSTSTSM